MTAIAIVEATKKNGISVLLASALFWLNGRLSNIEEKYAAVEMRLYDCLEDKSQSSSINHNIKKEYIYAILPKEENYGRIKRKMESKNS
jgi:hypothetical protein